jgi:hypothetical protein
LVSVFRLNFQLKKRLAEHETSTFLRTLPVMFNILLCLMLFDGYAAHNLYRETWYLVGAMAVSVGLLPVLQQQVTENDADLPGVPAANVIEQKWSPALLPVLRRQVPNRVPRPGIDLRT